MQHYKYTLLRALLLQDAEWATGTLCCHSPGAVYMLLKCSDFVSHELQHGCVPPHTRRAERNDTADSLRSYDHCVDFVPGGASPQIDVLALRSWSNLHRSNEMRVFVANDDIIAFSQRHTDAHFEHLGGEGGLQLAERVLDWWQGGLAEEWPHTHCTCRAHAHCHS